MKFGKQLELGTYKPWKEYYIQYNRLKRIIVRKKFLADKLQNKIKSSTTNLQGLQMTTLKGSGQVATENTPLVTRTPSPAIPWNSSFVSLAPEEDSKVYSNDSTEFFPVIIDELEKVNKFYIGKVAELRIVLEGITRSRSNSYLTHHTGSSDVSNLAKLRDIYLELKALHAYCELNKTGFYKIIKKYDKTLGEDTLKDWKRTIDDQQFSISTEPLRLIDIVTDLVSRNKLMEWEIFASEQKYKSDDEIFPSVKPHSVLISVLLFLLSLAFPIVTPHDVAANRCFSLLVLAVSLWVTEAVPYFATALIIPALVTFLRVLKDPKDPTKAMSPEESSAFVLDHIFNHTTMLLLGGYTISTAFARCQLELRVASFLQTRLGDRPLIFILAIMFLGLFLSMWINNHTAPILLATIILPIVRDLPTDSRFSKALLLGLAIGCNFGGMMTPISSLQNVLAVSYLEQAGIEVSFGHWILVSCPFCIVCVLIAWFMIIAIIQPNDIKQIPIIVYEIDNKVFGKRNVTVLITTLFTIILFASYTSVKDIFGDIGIVALCFVTFMFGTGILSEVDFNSLSWHTLFLVGGGNVLGKAVTSSGLLTYISHDIVKALPLEYPWLSLVYILLFTLAVATFVSHTVASLIMMPIISNIGLQLKMPEIVVMSTAFAVSAAMALPFSSFPNVNSLLIVDDFQTQYLNVKDYLKTGLPLSFITTILIATFGYVLIEVIIGTQ